MYGRGSFEQSWRLPLLPDSKSPRSHLYQNKYFISPLVSHTSASLRHQPLFFDIHRQTIGGKVGYPSSYHSAATCDFHPSLTPIIATLTDTPSPKSFHCHSYVKPWGVGRGPILFSNLGIGAGIKASATQNLPFTKDPSVLVTNTTDAKNRTALGLKIRATWMIRGWRVALAFIPALRRQKFGHWDALGLVDGFGWMPIEGA